MSILERLAETSTMDVDPTVDDNQPPCFQRFKINRKIETEKMLLKTYQELNSKFHTSNPSLVKTTNTAAADRKLKLDALVSERDSLPECLTFNCQFCPKNNPTTPVEVIAPVKNSNSLKKDNIDNNETKTSQLNEPVATANSFSDLVEDQNQVTEDKEAKIADVPKPRPPRPIHLKIKENVFRTQIKSIVQKFPDTITKNSGKFIKLYSKDVDEKHKLTQFLESDKNFEFFCTKPKLDKPINVVIKGLPIFSKTQEILSDLEEEFSVDNVTQLISKKHKGPLPFFQITLPRNANNSKIFDLKTLGYLQVRVEGFLVRGITQCYNCNNFFHTASECHLKPRCLKCDNEHPTKQCPIKERQENPFCINCQEYGHTACYTKCPHFPKPKKGAPLPVIQKLNKNKCKEGVTFANVVSGTNSPPLSTPNATDSIQPSEIKNSSKEIHGIIQEEKSDLAQNPCSLPSSTSLEGSVLLVCPLPPHWVAAVAEWYRHRIVAGFVTSSSPVPLKTRRVGQRCTLNLSRAETSSRWCGVVVRRGGASSGVVHVT
ncbi:nucleic-acid-binding protein from transposon X-element [Trichonephila clavipes]|nr:nucleic-acid-binding protein from transposon X-element [Trichonephila clavipes]